MQVRVLKEGDPGVDDDLIFIESNPETANKESLYNLPGCMVLRMTRDRFIQQHGWKKDVISVIKDANQAGYGDRSSSTCIGVASYFGKRATFQAGNSPVEGPGVAKLNQYFRTTNQIHTEYMVIANKLFNVISTIANSIRYKLDPFMTKLYMETNCESFNRMKTCTFGNDSYAAFGCEIHIDEADRFHESEVNELLLKLDTNYSQCHPGTDIHKERYEYAKKFIERFGCGRSSLIQYQTIFQSPINNAASAKDKFDIHQFFVMHGLHRVVKIVDGVSILFYPYAFLHGSSLPLIVFHDDTVQVKNTLNVHNVAISFTS